MPTRVGRLQSEEQSAIGITPLSTNQRCQGGKEVQERQSVQYLVGPPGDPAPCLSHLQNMHPRLESVDRHEHCILSQPLTQGGSLQHFLPGSNSTFGGLRNKRKRKQNGRVRIASRTEIMQCLRLAYCLIVWQHVINGVRIVFQPILQVQESPWRQELAKVGMVSRRDSRMISQPGVSYLP